VLGNTAYDCYHPHPDAAVNACRATNEEHARLPVSYRDHEFSYLKGRVDWSRLPAQRISMLSNLFCTEADAIRTAVEEAEAIAIDECATVRPANSAEIGNPMVPLTG